MIPDLDRDGVVDVAEKSQLRDHWRLDVWLSSRGGVAKRPADIVVNERFADQVDAFKQVGAGEDTNGDGVLEVTSLSFVLDTISGQPVPVVSIYSSTFGRPMMTLFGDGAETLMLVLEGQAIGSPVNELLFTIPQAASTRPDFELKRSSSGSSDSSGTSGTSDDSSSSGPGSWIDKGLQIPRITWTLREYDPYSWAWNIGRFWELSNIAESEAHAKFPNDSGKSNALRHALWQFLLTCQFGKDRAKDIGDIHEDASRDPCDTAIDQFNNQAARDLANSGRCKPFDGQFIRREDLDALIDDIVRDMDGGKFITDPTDPRVKPPCP
jgi:hypothetical protein